MRAVDHDLKIAKALGLTIPQSLLVRADVGAISGWLSAKGFRGGRSEAERLCGISCTSRIFDQRLRPETLPLLAVAQRQRLLPFSLDKPRHV